MYQHTATVVNVRVKHIRPKYDNLKEWMSDSDNVYIGRRGVVFIDGARYPPIASPYANPFKASSTMSLDQSIYNYEVWLREQIRSRKISAGQLASLSGKGLGCWCAPNRCHGDILRMYVDYYHVRRI